MSPGPARGYSWPSATPGNDLAMKHGAYSPRTWRPLADRLAAELATTAPWCCRASNSAAIAAWTRVEAGVQLLMAHLDEVGPLDDEGVPRPATALLTKMETQAANLRASLGLDPMSLARLLVAFSAAAGHAEADDALAALQAEGSALIAARAELEPVTDSDDEAE